MNTNLRPTHMRLVPCREGTKQARLVDLLARPEGATPEELLEACKPWDWETVKSALYWDINTVKGYGVRSGGARLFLVLPEGVPAPLPHKPLLPVRKPSAHQLALAERIRQAIGRPAEELLGREILDVCRQLDLRTEKGLPFNAGTSGDLRRRLRAFLESR